MKLFFRKKQHAFTLVEILVAMSIILLILAAVYGSYRAMSESITRCRPKNVLEQQANLILNRLTSELRCCFAESQNQTDGNTPALFTGKKVSANKNFLQFVTTSTNNGGLAKVSYKLDSSGTVLLQNVRKYTELSDKDDEDSLWTSILCNIKTISCEYLKDGKWENNWNSSEAGILPAAVKISLVLENGETGPVSFKACASIMCGGVKASDTGIVTTAAEIGL